MELIIFIGLQGSGKTTFYQTHFGAAYAYVSKDTLRAEKHTTKNERQSERIKDALQTQQSIVVDNTNVTIEDRAALIHLGREYGAQIVGYYFDTPIKQCVERNRGREGKAKVPDKVIYITAHRMVKPTYAEGFDRLYAVRALDNGEFETRDWPKEVLNPPL